MAAAIGLRRRVIPAYLQRATQIELSNLPRTATPADVRRLILRGQVQGVEDASIEYRRLEPTGRAYLKLTQPEFLLPNLDALEKVTVSGVQPVAEPSARPAMSDQMNGNGLGSELASDGKCVVIWGLPKAVLPVVVDQTILRGFSVPPGEDYIFKIPDTLGPKAFTFTSRFLVRLASVSEAHRLVRTIHMTNHRPERNGARYPLRARVIY
ncbi:hypothetical protein B0H15DRAFT_823878 [Mycena belliarum]|uniref:Uncharacterized protein n=1 Tax=Mycena belliarum TaxID=1033014 RepID=A0AAD6UEW4_9AGAR|nr:hypothetical protein B0H15DRAFT_823878 [Mycena belliae]